MNNIPKLIDPFNRAITYLRVSVTDRCDFRCVYCMSENMNFLPKADLLTLEELDKMCSAFISQGVEKLRITGGEPLVRRNIMEFFESISRHLKTGELKELTLTTNGSQLHRFAEKLSEKYFPNVNVINFSGSGIETTFTQGEDACLEAVIRSLPSSEKTQLAVLGALPDIVQDQMMRLLNQLGLENIFVLPQIKCDDDVSVGPNTHFICVQPFLGASYEEMVRRGAIPISANFPFGADGTTRWLWAIAERFGVSKAKFDKVVAAPKLRAEQAIAAVASDLRGKSVFFFPDSQLEIPLARFLAAECGLSSSRS